MGTTTENSMWVDLPEAVADSATPDIKDNPADYWIDLPKPNVRPTAINALVTKPEQAARVGFLAEQYNRPVGLVAAAQKDFEERAAADRAEKAMADAPKLAEFFVKEPTTAAIMQDDLDNVAGLEKILWGMKPANKPADTWLPFASANGLDLNIDGGWGERGVRSLQEGVLGMMRATHGQIQPLWDALAQLPSPDVEVSQGMILEPRSVPFFKFLAEDGRQLDARLESLIRDTPYTAAEGALKVYEDFVRSSPLMATQLALGVLTKSLTLPAAFMGGQIAGGQYAELTGDGVDGFTAFTAALANAAVQLPLERIQLGKLADIFKTSGGWQIAKNVGTAALTSFTTELVQNYPDALTTIWAKSFKDGRDEGMVMAEFFRTFWDTTAQGAYEGALSIPWALLGGAGKIVHDLSHYKTLKQDKEFFAALDESAATSRVKQRLPQAYQKTVEHLTSGGPVETLYLSPEGMRSAIGDENVLFQTINDLGVTQEQFARAEELGADIEVPVSLYQSKVAGTDVSLALRGEFRTSPDGMTLREQANFEQDFSEIVSSMVEEHRDNLLQDDALDAVLAPIEEELVTVYGKEGARANAALLRTRAVMATEDWRKAGRDITPAQWLSELNRVRVDAGSGGQGQSSADLFMAAKKVIYSDDRALKLTYEDTGVEPSLTERGPLREYIWSLDRTELRGLRDKDPGAYMGIIRSIARKFMSGEADIRLRRADGNIVDYEHFAGRDVTRNEYLPSLLSTLKNEDIRLDFTTKEGKAKAYLIKRYFDPEIQKDIWDMLVIEDNELKTKIARKGQKGTNTIESTILRADNEVPRSAAIGGATENTSTPRNVTDENILPSDADGKTLFHPEARGSISFPSDTNPETLIRIFKDSADFSTFVHEIGHLFVQDMENLVATGMAPEHVARDLDTLKAFAGEFSDPTTLQYFYEKTFQPMREKYAGRDFFSLTTQERDTIANVAVQEKLADAFVQYMNEGKAPSPGLRSVFRRFKDWLQRLYKNVANVFPINDEVRAVFDRMLATEQDIKAADEIHRATIAEDATISEVAMTMLTEAENARLKKASEEAAALSREKRLSKVLSAFYRAGADQKQITEQVKTEVNAIPVYAAMDEAIQLGGISYDEVAATFGIDTSRAIAKKRPGLLRKEGPVSPVTLDDLAVAHDFASADALVSAIMEAPGKGAFTKARVAEERAKREKVIRDELGLDDLQVAGEEDYYSGERLEALELQAKALRKKTGQRGRNLGSADTLRQMAKGILESMPYKESRNIGRLSAAEAKQADLAARALAKGDTEGAAEAKRRQAINHAMVLEAMNYRQEEQVFGRALRRYLKSDKMLFEYQEQIRSLVERFKLLPHIGPYKRNELPGLRDFIKEVTEDNIFEAPPFQDIIYALEAPKDMTLEQMREVRFAIKWLAEEGNPGEAKLVTEKGKLADAVKVGVSSLADSGNIFTPVSEHTAKRTAQDAWQDLFAGLDHTKFMLMAADGYQEIGKNAHKVGFHSRWFNKVMAAQNEFNAMFRKARPELVRIGKVRQGFVDRFKKEHGNSKIGLGRAAAINGIQPPKVMKKAGKTHWTAEHVWSIARNMGNAGNLKTLTKGYGLSNAQLLSLTSILTKEEWLSIQAECELMGQHFEATDAVFRQIYGKPTPDKVEPLPLSVRTAEGEILDLPGWYFPISVDGTLSPDIGDKQGIDMISGKPEFSAYGPSLAKGHTKGRTGTEKPVALEFRVFDKSLQDQWRFLTHAPVIRDFDRITRNAEWREAYTDAFGPEYYKQLRTWLKYVARPDSQQGDVLDRFMNNERKRSTVFILGLNFSTMIRQFQGYFQATPELGSKWILKGISRATHNPMALVRHINEQSLFLADRDRNFVRELRKSTMPPESMRIPFTEKKITMEDVQDVSMSLITFGDRLTTYPIWQGAYIKATEALNMNHDQAVEFADGIIQKTQASNTAADLNQWQREDGKSWRRLYSMFMSEALRKGSRMRYYWRAKEKGQITTGEYVNHLCMESIAPALFYVGVRALLTSSVPEPEDVLEQALGEIIGPVPILSAIPGSIQYGKDIMDSPAFTGIKQRKNAGVAAWKLIENPTSEKAQAKFFKSLVDMAAFQTGAGNVRRVYETAAQGAEDIFDDKTVNPFRLFLKKPKK